MNKLKSINKVLSSPQYSDNIGVIPKQFQKFKKNGIYRLADISGYTIEVKVLGSLDGSDELVITTKASSKKESRILTNASKFSILSRALMMTGIFSFFKPKL